MKVISKAKASRNVNTGLHEAVTQVNKELKNVNGVITKLECDISVRPSGAYVSVMVTVNGDQPWRKEIFGVNTRGANREHSVKKATKSLNELLKDKGGGIVGVYSKTATSLPGRVYTTMIAAVNEDETQPTVNDANSRRERIKKTLELLDNTPEAINIAKVAEIFGVSRSMIYRDLEVLGFDRGGESEK